MHHPFDPESNVLLEIRLKSQRFVQCLFGMFTLAFALLGLCAHVAPHHLAVDGWAGVEIAHTFLALAALYLVCLLVWEHIYPVSVRCEPDDM